MLTGHVGVGSLQDLPTKCQSHTLIHAVAFYGKALAVEHDEIEHSHAEKVAPCQCLFEQEPWALYSC